jgi:hypothetical protein
MRHYKDQQVLAQVKALLTPASIKEAEVLNG